MLCVSLRAEEVEIADFEIAEELAVVVFSCCGVEEPEHICFRVDEVWVFRDEVESGAEEGREGTSVFEDGHVEAVDHLEGREEEEGIVGDGAEEVDLEE